MKRIILGLCLLLSGMVKSQDLNDIFVAGVADAERFSNAYFAPVAESAVYSISNGWYNSGKSKPLGGFEISIVGNITGFKNKDDKQSFILDPADYDNVDFVVNPGQARSVSTALGDFEGVVIVVEDDDGLFREEIELLSGLASEDFNFIPSGYIQAAVGLVKGLEVKARFLPKIKFDDDAEIGLFGAGIQYEFTKLLPADKIWPVAISGVIGYTNLNGEYDFTDSNVIDGSNQRIDANMRSWNISAVISTTKIPVINFYGGLGYITGKSDIDVLGTYEANGPFLSVDVTDPFTVATNVSGVNANLGAKIKLGFFRLNAEYNLGEFNTLTFGLNFGFR